MQPACNYFEKLCKSETNNRVLELLAWNEGISRIQP